MDKVKVLHCSRSGYFASAGLVDSARGTTSVDSPQGVWADADDGSGPNGREYNEEDEEVEENEFDFEGDDVTAVDKHGGNQYEDEWQEANGTLTESEIPRVTKALEETEGISNLKVQVLEGIGTVELTKHTTVQATGAASSLVEIIQGAGFKLQTLNLSFGAEEDILV